MVGDIPSPIVALFWIILGILSIVALLGNGFITALIGHQWLQNRIMGPLDFLLISLSTTRFLLQLLSPLGYPVYFNVPRTNFYSTILTAMSISWFFLHIVNIWCATWLSIFYCVKVTNFPNRLFFWLKSRINVLAPRLFVMLVIVSFIFSLPSTIGYFQNKKAFNLTETQFTNYCQDMFCVPLSLELSILAINFSLNVLASLLLLTSLWRHTRNLRENGIALKDLNTQVHIKVMKSILLYLFLYVLYITGMILGVANIFEFGTPERLVTEILLSSLSSIHSTMIILTNPKMKKVSAEILKIRERT
ncbi:taste receptor type 2 member 41-like [Pogona vitticeps]